MAFKRKINGKLLVIMAIIAVLSMEQKFESHEVSDTEQSNKQVISCNSPYIIDGDTFSCNGERIRMANIDAPEMPEHCRRGRRCPPGTPFASKNCLHSISRGSVTCLSIEKDHYGRTVARCKANGKDLSCAMVAAGHAIERYGVLNCQ